MSSIYNAYNVFYARGYGMAHLVVYGVYGPWLDSQQKYKASIIVIYRLNPIFFKPIKPALQTHPTPFFEMRHDDARAKH